MTLPTTNLSFSAIQTEFGGSNPINLSEYYRGGTYVRTNTTMPNGTISTSGAISLSTFRGATQGVVFPAAGTILSQGCVAYGTAPYTYRVTRADGSGGSYNEDTNNSPSCGYVAPVPPSSATWSVGYSNSGSQGPISVFVLVTLNRPATVSTTYTFTGVVVQNNVAFSVPSVTIGVGSTSNNPSAFSGVTNGSGPYVPITLRATPSSVPYPLTPSGAIDTTFNYSA